jgi:hypothetical protein
VGRAIKRVTHPLLSVTTGANNLEIVGTACGSEIVKLKHPGAWRSATPVDPVMPRKVIKVSFGTGDHEAGWERSALSLATVFFFARAPVFGIVPAG